MERVLRQREVTITSGFGHTAAGLDESIREAAQQYTQDGDLFVFSEAVKEAVHATATWTAYVAAECDNDEPEFDVPADVEQRLLGKPWRAIVSELRRLPPADVPTDRAELDLAATRVALAIRDWVVHIGFLWQDEDGEFAFRWQSQNQWGL